MAVDDPNDIAGRLESQRNLLADSETVHEADRDAIAKWVRRRSGRLADSSLATYLRRLRQASERSAAPITTFDEDDYHEFVFCLRHDYCHADSTIQGFENALLPFIEDITGAEWPEDVERTTVTTERLDPKTILTPADIQQLTTTARHQRDVAFIEFLADTGARLSLALSLRVGDVTLGRPPTYTPNEDATGLKGAAVRPYPLIDAAAALRSYLRTSHPRPNDPGVALFHKIKPASRDGDERWTDDGAVRANAMRQQLRRVGERAGVDKPVNPHAFRHAAVTRMAREGYTRSQIEHRVHWTLDSDMWKVYEHVTGTDHNEDIFAAAGLIEGSDAPQQVRKPCGGCREPLAPHHEFCPNCGMAATRTASESVAEERERRMDELVDESDAAVREELRALLDEIDERQEVVHDSSPSS